MTGYADVALLYLERGFAPFPVRGKRPVPAGATGRNGTVTPEKVADWVANGFRWLDHETEQWHTQDPKTANTALRAGQLEVRIDVDAYGNKRGDEQLAELEAKLGPLPATPSSTSRGIDSPSRQYFYVLPEPVELAGKAADDIDIIQFRHRYSLVWPSVNPEADDAPYVWYDADGAPMDGPPSLDDLEMLPQAWIDHLRVDDREYGHTSEQWDGEIPDAATQHEARKLRAIVSRLEELHNWDAGLSWHDVVRDMGCWLWRIARSNAYALTPEQGFQLLVDHTPLDEKRGGVKGLRAQWESFDRTTAGQFEPPPDPDAPDLLPWDGFPTSRVFPMVNGEPFSSLWMSLPADPTPQNRWAHRRTLFMALLQSGFTDQEAATFVWHSAAAAHPGFSLGGGPAYIDPDSRIISEIELWRELHKAREALASGTGETADAAPPDERPSLEAPTRLSFLDEKERALLAGPAGVWWGSRFIDWAYATFSHTNEPYYRMNRWTILSVIFSPKAVLPRPGGNDRPLNIYQGIVGTTTSGKTEALRTCKHTFNAYYLLADKPDIGGNHTPESLVETLISKDGQSTWFHVDEAHTKIAVWKKPVGPYTEMPGVITDVYDGDVGAIYRATKKDISGKSARAFMTVHLMGTPRGMTDVMGPDDWESGFLNRFVWAIGDLPVDSMESVAGDWVDEDGLDEDETADATAGLKIYQQWAAEFAGAVAKVSKPSGMPARMKLSKAVIKRHQEFAWALTQVAHQRAQYADRLRPTFRRLGETVMRCAALVALSKGSLEVTMTDLLIAIQQAEEWATNICFMVEQTDESLRTREVNAIEKAILDHGGQMTLAAIHRLPRFRNRRRDVEDLIQELVAQGRAQKDKQGAIDVVKTKGIYDERSAA